MAEKWLLQNVLDNIENFIKLTFIITVLSSSDKYLNVFFNDLAACERERESKRTIMIFI